MTKAPASTSRGKRKAAGKATVEAGGKPNATTAAVRAPRCKTAASNSSSAAIGAQADAVSTRANIELLLPPRFRDWFAHRGWTPRSHQLALLEAAKARRSSLLIAPTGAGKTLAGFLPSLTDLAADDSVDQPANAQAERPWGIHTLYISPLKALAVDVARNLLIPVERMGLDIRIETRTGDTPPSRRQRQKRVPPDILLTTPEQLALLLSHDDARQLFAGLRTVILDELHALVMSKRGDLLSLGLARLRSLAPDLMAIGLSATVARPSELRAFLLPQTRPEIAADLADQVSGPAGARPEISVLESGERLPWSGHSSRYALPEVYQAIRAHRMTLVFVNTRAQSELVFQELWNLNEDGLPIALHHGSLDREQRRKIEKAMAEGRLKAVVCTSTLDLGIDWGDVDLVIHVGAPKGASRLAQRIGRANHRLDEPSRAILVPSNRFEVLECRAAVDAAEAGAQDTPLGRVGGLDVLAQHLWGMACAGPFHPHELYAEICSAKPYMELDRGQFDRVLDFVATGGYALRAYERYARLRPMPDGRLRLSHPRLAQQYRMNVGTIIESPMVRIRMTRRRGHAAMAAEKNRTVGSVVRARTAMPSAHGGRNSAQSNAPAANASPQPQAFAGGRVLGEVEEWFIEQLSPGDTFAFAGQVLRFEGLRETEAFVTRSSDENPMIPSYAGGKFPLSTYIAERVRQMLADEAAWDRLPDQVAQWLRIQKWRSALPQAGELLVETFPRARKHYLICYPFEGRLAHQTLGMLLTRRLDRFGMRPLGFVANDYAMAIWAARDLGEAVGDGSLDLATLYDADMLGDDLDAWLAASNLMKRTFRMCAVIAGLIERRHPGNEKSGRQVTFSSDIIYDVLRRHEPGHILLEAAWADAASGLLDIGRLSDFLNRIKGRIRHKGLSQVSPLAVPVMLEVGREPVQGRAGEELLREAAAELIREATTQDGSDD